MPTLPLTVIGQLHPDTIDYSTRVRRSGGTISSNKIKSLDLSIIQAYNLGLRDRNRNNHRLRYLLATAIVNGFNGCNVPLWDDGVGNATLNNYVSGDWNASGLAGNGTSKFINTWWNPSAKGLTDNANLFQYVTSISLGATSSVYGSDSGTAISTFNTYYKSAECGANFFGYLNPGDYAYVATDISSGLLLANRQNSNNLRFVNNVTTLFVNTMNSIATIPNLPLYFGAYNNNGTPSGYYSDRILFVGAGAGLTNIQESMLYSMLNNLKDLGV